jgi:4-hydroxy-3-methylbut-2-enyl diphosphate reductase IspH
MADSVEERVMQLKEKKRTTINAALSHVGKSRKEAQTTSIKDIKFLIFGSKGRRKPVTPLPVVTTGSAFGGSAPSSAFAEVVEIDDGDAPAAQPAAPAANPSASPQ